MAGAEFEFYHYKETAESIIEKNGVGLTPMTPGMFGYSIQRPTLNQDYYYDVLETAYKMDVNLEGWHTETGPGVYEAAIEYDEACKTADNAVIFKLICKSLGPKYGIIPCFMAKPQEGLPGNSGHLHVSLRDENGKNLFSRDESDPSAEWSDIKDLSDIGRWFLAGVLEGLPDIMPLFAPTINSYKRLVEHFWAPVTVSWGHENRLSSIRLISSGPASKSTRFEIRTPGADVNTHYALAAIFALGYRGIEKKLPIKIPPLSKSATTIDGLEKLPRSLQAATDRFAAPNSLAREALGDEFVEHFAGTRYEELRLWNNAVTNWEVKRYIETV
jgi:glutamine synthetase